MPVRNHTLLAAATLVLERQKLLEDARVKLEEAEAAFDQLAGGGATASDLAPLLDSIHASALREPVAHRVQRAASANGNGSPRPVTRRPVSRSLEQRSFDMLTEISRAGDGGLSTSEAIKAFGLPKGKRTAASRALQKLAEEGKIHRVERVYITGAHKAQLTAGRWVITRHNTHSRVHAEASA